MNNYKEDEVGDKLELFDRKERRGGTTLTDTHTRHISRQIKSIRTRRANPKDMGNWAETMNKKTLYISFHYLSVTNILLMKVQLVNADVSWTE